MVNRILLDKRGVSPVIGVILMVAITVVLAAVIGTFVLGFSGELGDSAPQARFNFNCDTGADTVTITHEGGDALEGSNINVTGPSGSTGGGSGTWVPRAHRRS